MGNVLLDLARRAPPFDKSLLIFLRNSLLNRLVGLSGSSQGQNVEKRLPICILLQDIDSNLQSKRDRNQLCCTNVKIDHKVDLQTIAQSCNRYVGGDLHALCREIARIANRRSTNGEQLTLMMEDWEEAKSEVGPSITKDIVKELPKVS
ncbi:hypothetical protein KSP39_PZI005874 [Platanthera zijinensis]|uniref:AAA ATPase AAA+ lid domain-containing protein n=1 Tax=Platanthera zijinensis TaxID=2320716 RepID=A0AAP0GBT8_9ASPA